VRDLQGRVQSLQSQPQDQTQGPQMIALGGAGTEQGVRAKLVTLEGDRAVLVAENMPPAPEGKTYQIWVIKGDTPKPSGLFEPKGDSIAAVVENPVEGADAVAVTIEPEGGSQEPTTDPMLVGKVKA
jgi:anti-sigma-K factor RskA